MVSLYTSSTNNLLQISIDPERGSIYAVTNNATIIKLLSNETTEDIFSYLTYGVPFSIAVFEDYLYLSLNSSLDIIKISIHGHKEGKVSTNYYTHYMLGLHKVYTY